MAIIRHFGRPTLFITFTANPKWEEIQRELYKGQTAVHRPDITARVFRLKVKSLLKELKQGEIFGRFRGCVWTIEYQKRGLLYLHLLLFLHTKDRFIDAEKLDQIICAELPDPSWDPDGSLRDIVTSIMIYGPCGANNSQSLCMVAVPGALPKCFKRFPRPFQFLTVV